MKKHQLYIILFAPHALHKTVHQAPKADSNVILNSMGERKWQNGYKHES